MISKELLSEVLEIDIEDVNSKLVKNILQFSIFTNSKKDIDMDSINIYELAYKCKEWALKNGNHINSEIDTDCSLAVLFYKEKNNGILKEAFKEDTEPEAIFKACQYILDNK